MPLLFSYGTLQQAEVQVATIGRRLAGSGDELPGHELASVRIEDPGLAATYGRTHNKNARYTGDERTRVTGTVFEVTESELARLDKYEAPDDYRRKIAALASGREAWVYVHAPEAARPDSPPP